MPSVAEMSETCRHLMDEVRQNPNGHRLLEIETIVRLLVPHLTRAVADGVHAGQTDALRDAGADLVQLRADLTRIDDNRDGSSEVARQQLLGALGHATSVLNALARL